MMKYATIELSMYGAPVVVDISDTVEEAMGKQQQLKDDGVPDDEREPIEWTKVNTGLVAYVTSVHMDNDLYITQMTVK